MRIIACLLAIVAVANPAAARQHHRRHAAPAGHQATSKPPAAPAGATTVPASGLKVYCAGRKSPILVRKFTQGSGTTVTVLCR